MSGGTFGPGDRRHILTGVVSALMSTTAAAAAAALWLVPVMDEKIRQNRSEIAVNRGDIADLERKVGDDAMIRSNLRVTIEGLAVEVRSLNAAIARLEARLNRQEDRTYQWRGGPGGYGTP